MTHPLGATIPLAWEIHDAAGDLVDAGSVQASVARPDDTVEAITPTRVSIGRYEHDYVPTLVGRYVISAASTSPSTAIPPEVVNVVGAESAALVSLAAMKRHLNMSPAVTDDDDELRDCIVAASIAVERHTKRIWARRTIAEDVTPDASGTALMNTAPLVAVEDAVSIDGATDYTATILDAANGIVSVAAPGPVRLTVRAGEAVIPEHVQTATLIIGEHLWQTQRLSRLDDTAEAPVSGRGYLIPNRAVQLLGGRAPNRP